MQDDNPSSQNKPRKRFAITAIAVAGALALSAAFIPVFDSFGPGASAQTARVEQAAQPLGHQVDPMSRAPLSFASIVKKVRPAVVSVNVEVSGPKVSSNEEGPGGQQGQMPNFRDLPQDHPFNEFFKKFFGEPGTPQPFRGPRGHRPFGRAQGSGFIISEDGYVVTNNHVVENASKVELTMDDGTSYKADIIGKDSKTDLALLKIEADETFPYVALSDKDIEIGDWVVAVGNPFGLGGTVTAGIVSARGRDIGAGPYDDFIQIDASINKGNSGGPAFNLDGEVVGVNTAIFSPSGGSIGIGFAIPVNLVRDVVAELKETGSVTRGWLGVQIQSVDDDIANSLGLKDASGAIVADVFDDSPAADAKLQANDVILTVDGTNIADAKDLARKVGNMKPDQTAKVTVFRDGKRQTLEIRLGKQPAGDLAQADEPDEEDAPAAVESKIAELGLSLASASEVPGASGDGVVVVGVDPDSEAAEKGIEVGDMILQVNGKNAATPDDVKTEMKAVGEAGRGSVLFRIRSGERPRFVVLDVKKG